MIIEGKVKSQLLIYRILNLDFIRVLFDSVGNLLLTFDLPIILGNLIFLFFFHNGFEGDMKFLDDLFDASHVAILGGL
jgi:hypothetical protein